MSREDEDSGSEYGTEQAAMDNDNDKEEGDFDGSDGGNRNGVTPDNPPRKRGGQRGKRKLKDMYLALDGSALLTLGTYSSLTMWSLAK